ncbi:MAG: hypothetical protein M1438_18655 [Deltaproteobacteria bacterium]|nr:hypothetical protein [Deltaproteobacteria bacterium]
MFSRYLWAIGLLVLSLAAIFGLAQTAKEKPQQLPAVANAAPAPSPKIQLPQSEKYYLQKATGFLMGNYEADKAMNDSMQKAQNHTATIPEIRRVIELSANLHKDLYANYQTTTPPPAYKAIHAKITRYAKLRSHAFNELSRGFGTNGLFVPKEGLPHVERGRDEFIESVRQGGVCLQELNKQMDKLIAAGQH